MKNTIITRWARRAARASSAKGLAIGVALTLAAAATGASAQVQSQALKPLDLWSAGGRDTGLPDTLWKDTSPDLARQVLGVLPDRPLSPAMATLARRVLATAAAAPDGAGSDAGLAALRIRALVSLGDLAAAEQVLSRTPSIEASEALSRMKADVALLNGRDQDACDAARNLQQGRDGQWWLKLRALCGYVDKQPAAAQVALDLWRQGGGKAPAFERLLSAAINGLDPGKPSVDDPMVYALSRRLGLDLAPLASTAPMPIAAAMARDPNTPPAARLEAMSRALRLEAFPVQTVREAYLAAEGVTTAPAGTAPPGWNAATRPLPTLAQASADPGATGEAALFAIAMTSHDMGEREAAISALLGRSKTNIDYLALSRLASPAIARLAEDQPALRDPILFASASAMAWDVKTAQAIRSNIRLDSGAGATALDLALLDALIACRSSKGEGLALDQLVDRGGAGDPKARGRAQAAALLMAETGARMSPRSMAQFSAFELAPGKTSPARLAALDAAATDRRMGETALLALAVAEPAAQGLSTADRAAIAAALLRAGFKREASEVVAQGLIAFIGK